MRILLKIIGTAFIILSCVGIGTAKAMQCSERVHLLKQAKILLITFKQRLTFTLAEPEMLLKELCNDAKFKNCVYLHQANSNCSECGFEAAWKMALEQTEQAFKKEDKELLMQAGMIIGKSDLATQQQLLEQLLQQIDSTINDAKKQNEEKQKMYVSLGTLAGLMLTVIFI